MKTTPYPKKANGFAVNSETQRLTASEDVRALCWLASLVKGNILEIGCNKGLTTRDLAINFPDRIIYAVDCFLQSSGMLGEQSGERPTAEDFCIHARGLPNVACVHGLSQCIPYRALSDVSLVFVDGNHSYEGVKADSEPAIKHLSKVGGILAWHDYYEGAPDWVGVARYLQELPFEIEVVEGTWLAYAIFEPEAPKGRK